jgi:hypothetical protein
VSAGKALRAHLKRGDMKPADAPAPAISPAAAWPFPRPDDKVKVEAPTDDVAIEDQRAIADEQRKTAKKKAKKK